MARWETVAPGVAKAEGAAARLRRALADPGVRWKPAELAERRRCGGGGGLERLGPPLSLFLISYSNFSAPTQLHRHWSDAVRGDVRRAARPLAAGRAAQLF